MKIKNFQMQHFLTRFSMHLFQHKLIQGRHKEVVVRGFSVKIFKMVIEC